MLKAKKNCLCPNYILYQGYNILLFDDLSITRYNKFCQIQNLSFRGKRVIVSHLSPKKANSFASPHISHPLTSPKKIADSFASPNTNVYCLLTAPKNYPFKFDSGF
jgi:hypothetical protein